MTNFSNLIASYAELGSCIPDTGGAYVYIQRVYGDMLAFLYTWTIVSAANPASTGAVAIIFGEYVTRASLPGEVLQNPSIVWIQRCFALLAVWIAIGLNSFGTRWGLMVNQICTFLKLIGVFCVSLFGVIFIGRVRKTFWR
jgi:amino acid transporter